MEFQKEPGRIFAEDEQGELLCEITYPTQSGVIDITHTYVSDRLRGQGVAGKLMASAVEEIASQNLPVKLTCSYAVKWMESHPETAEVLTIMK